ncbi:MFS transporter [Amycolatopsis anabasis]|uniref:MFS transporter n=1 Tax=Amycolatopsis anabasis TaxID=1840409 RepID=UPI00131D69D7|nr:MFS transporter [Amycolatopsis anabasis]
MTGIAPTAAGSQVLDDRTATKVTFAALVGNALEWYDFFLFTTATALVFNVQYFASDDPVTAAMASFATLAVGFIARPLGGLIFGRMGDRVGRRRTLLITVVLIGVTTGLIGVLPNQFTIGVAAPILLTLLRIVQGLALGGEWSGAIIIAVEHAPPAKRGRFAALPQIGSPIGTLLSSGAFALVSLLSRESFDAWGWRLPFLAAIPLLLIAVFIRRQLEESPAFRELVEHNEVAHAPLTRVFRESWRQVLVGAGVAFLGMGGFYLVTTFVISYGTRVLHLDRTLLLSGTLVAAVGEIFVIVVAGRLTERFGATRVVAGGGLATAILAFPVFWLIESRAPVLVILAMTIGVGALSFSYGACGTVLAGLFPPALRYSGVAIASNAAAVLSGCVPLIATALFAASGNQIWTAAVIFIVIALTTGVSGLFFPRLSIGEAGIRN